MEKITKRVRDMRKDLTQSEQKLWGKLRAKQTGFKIVRQKPILFKYLEQSRAFIADFYCKETNVIIEVDGLIHKSQIEYDKLRTELLSIKEYEVIRYENSQIIEDVESVVKDIESFLRKRREDGTKCQERGVLP